jgi:hypothetical protein
LHQAGIIQLHASQAACDSATSAAAVVILPPTYIDAPSWSGLYAYLSSMRVDTNLMDAIPYRQCEASYHIPQPTYNIQMVVALAPNDAGNQTATFNDHPFPMEDGKGFMSYPPVAFQSTV